MKPQHALRTLRWTTTGFTLIEILITIGILMLLIGIAVFSMNKVGTTAKNNAARTTLGNFKGMLAELEATAGLKSRQPGHMWVNKGTVFNKPAPPATPPVPETIDIWNDARPDVDTDPDPVRNSDEPLFVPAGTVGSENPSRLESDAVRNTQLVMLLLVAAPNNQRALSNLPSDSTVKLADITDTGTFNEDQQPVGVPLDPWGNPIIFVPSAGLCGDNVDEMWIGGAPNASGAKKVIALPPVGSTTEVGPIRSPDGRPFWASAGPDGSFGLGDDNLYSFE